MANNSEQPSKILKGASAVSEKIYAPIKKVAAVTIPPAAAFGKAFGNSFGTICLLLLFTQGITSSAAITSGMLTWPILTIAGICFFGVAFISLFMEGRKTWQYILAKTKKDQGSKQSPDVSRKTPNRFLLAIRNALLPLLAFIPLSGAVAKGATMAFGTFVTVGILFGVTGGAASIAILTGALVCGFAVALVSLGKEGRDTYKHLKAPISRWLGIHSQDSEKTDEHSKSLGTTDEYKKGLVQTDEHLKDLAETDELKNIRNSDFIRVTRYGFKATGLYYAGQLTKDAPIANEAVSWIPSTLAAVGKGFGNAFGMVKIVAFLSGIITGNPLALTSPWNIPLILVVGLSEFIISMAFEGNHFRRHCQHGMNQVLEVPIEAKKQSQIGTMLEKYFYPLPRPLRAVLGFAVSGIAAIAKGATMGFGMVTTLGILSKIGMLGLPIIAFSNPVGGIILGLVIFSAIAVGMVSWAKEGKEVRNWASAENPHSKAAQNSTELEETAPLLEQESDLVVSDTVDALALEDCKTHNFISKPRPTVRYEEIVVPSKPVRAQVKGQQIVPVTTKDLAQALKKLKPVAGGSQITTTGENLYDGFGCAPTGLARIKSSPNLHSGPPIRTIERSRMDNGFPTAE